MLQVIRANILLKMQFELRTWAGVSGGETENIISSLNQKRNKICDTTAFLRDDRTILNLLKGAAKQIQWDEPLFLLLTEPMTSFYLYKQWG